MRAVDAIRRPPATIECDRTITEAAQVMDEHAVGALVVTDHGRPVGIVTDRDLAVRAVARRLAHDARIDGVMSADLRTLPADADLRDVLVLFKSTALRRIPLVEDDRVVGMLTVDDLLVDLAAGLSGLVRPVTHQVVFGRPQPKVPATA